MAPLVSTCAPLISGPTTGRSEPMSYPTFDHGPAQILTLKKKCANCELPFLNGGRVNMFLHLFGVNMICICVNMI